jgi:hypothetical protein
MPSSKFMKKDTYDSNTSSKNIDQYAGTDARERRDKI